jgi:N-acetylglucosamine-6-phosphate deacetylase
MNRILEAIGPEGFGNYDVEWGDAGPKLQRVNRPAQGVLIPGFVDLHIHGAFGIDFMTASTADMNLLCEKLSTEGYEAFLPTTVTASLTDVLAAIKKLPKNPMIAGFHLEGPFISPKHPGAQPPKAIEVPPEGASPWDEVFMHPMLRYITLAPEQPHALELTSRLMQRNVIVSMGHTDATYDQARAGYEFGASHTTHTFNAMRGFHHREGGVVGYALMNSSLRTELIYDRRHVCREAAELLFKCRPLDRIVAVSDSTMATGMPPNLPIKMWGVDCVTGTNEVRLKNGTLAGSAITLLDAFKNLAEDFGLEVAITTCCVNPRTALKMTGPPVVYVELDRDFNVVERFVAKNSGTRSG